MKNNINNASGFTIAELLVTMLITMVVAAAMVPVIGLKKVKMPINKYNHGIAECYYEPTGFDGNGDATGWQMTYYYADNGKNRNAEAQTLPEGSEYCTFIPPKSDYFEIITIGAGTDGYDMVPQFHVSDSSSNGLGIQHGYIRVDGHYQEDLDKAHLFDNNNQVLSISAQLRQLIDSWANSDRSGELYADYLFDSPIADGAPAYCKVKIRSGRYLTCDCTGSLNSPKCKGPVTPKTGKYFYDTHIDENWQTDKCWYFLHSDSTKYSPGSSGGTTKPLRIPLSSSIEITSNLAPYGLTVRDSKEVKTHGITKKAYKTVAEVALNPSKAPIFQTNDCWGDGYYSRYNTLEAVCYDSPTMWHYPNSSYGAQFDASCEGDVCSSLGFKIDDRPKAASAAGGIENVYTKSCELNQGEKGSMGTTYYSSSRSNLNTDPNMLRWAYTGTLANPRAGSSGQPGKEQSIVYGSLKNPLYLMPAKYLASSDHPTAQDYKNNITDVRENPSDANTSLISAQSGLESGKPINMPYQMISQELPIPSEPLELAKPDNENLYSYLARVNTAKYGGGLAGCDENPNAIRCPGFAGKGQYFYMREVPNQNALTLTNLYNNAFYSIPMQKMIEDKQLNLGDPICDDGLTRPLALSPVYYIDSATNQRKSYTPYYCKEKKLKGSPGAVIIIW